MGRKLGTVGKYRRDLMKRIAAMPGAPTERFRYLKLFNATGRDRRRRAFRPMSAMRSMWDQIDQQAPTPLKAIPAGSSFLQRLRTRVGKVDQRRALLSAIDYIAVRARIMAIERKARRRRK